MAPELTSNNVNPYGEGAPFGDLFQVAPAPVGGPVYCDAHLLGHGPPLLLPSAVAVLLARREVLLAPPVLQPVTVQPPSLDDSDSDTSQPTTTDASTDTDHDFGSVDDDGISHPLDKCALQSYVTKIFRRVCHVSGRHWPDPDVICASPVTLEVYPTPVFSVHVMDLRNRDLVDVVARSRSATSSRRGKKLKTSKLQYKKSEQLAKVVDIFATDHHLDPGFLADLIHEQYLSDKVSGPEDEAVETKEWKVRLAAAANLPLDPAAQK
ncbi:hypothetical protein B0H14DRAFT_3162033 [Mycena olivaceomarginata]|nr:hypothetical protein B0H14DRAFT_3162033 [Mycena olivaceomarginata]